MLIALGAIGGFYFAKRAQGCGCANATSRPPPMGPVIIDAEVIEVSPDVGPVEVKSPQSAYGDPSASAWDMKGTEYEAGSY